MSKECYFPFGINDLIKLSIDAVKYSPPTGKVCEQLQSAVYLKDWGDIDGEDLGASFKSVREKNHLYMRSAKISFPAVMITPDTFELRNLFNGPNHEEVDMYEIVVIDEYYKECNNCGPCGKRDQKAIREDLRALLRQWYKYIQGAVYASYVEGGESTGGWYNGAHVAHLEANGDITNVDTHYVQSRNMISSLRKANPNVQPMYIHFGRSYIGVKINLKLPKDICESFDMAFDQNHKNKAFK